MSKEEIKNCPFCGEVPEINHSNGAGQVWCPNDKCDLIGFVDSDSPFLDDVFNKWNSRVKESKLQEENEKLRDQVKERDEIIESIPYCKCFEWARCGTVEEVLKGGHHPKCGSHPSGASR